MIVRLSVTLLATLFALSAASAQPKTPRVALPAAMLGVWGVDAEACKGPATEEENRLEVEPGSLLLFVTAYSVKTWQRSGDLYSARAERGEEGESKPSPGRYRVSLKLVADGKLEFRVNRESPTVWVKCPAGTRIQ